MNWKSADRLFWPQWGYSSGKGRGFCTKCFESTGLKNGIKAARIWRVTTFVFLCGLHYWLKYSCGECSGNAMVISVFKFLLTRQVHFLHFMFICAPYVILFINSGRLGFLSFLDSSFIAFGERIFKESVISSCTVWLEVVLQCWTQFQYHFTPIHLSSCVNFQAQEPSDTTWQASLDAYNWYFFPSMQVTARWNQRKPDYTTSKVYLEEPNKICSLQMLEGTLPSGRRSQNFDSIILQIAVFKMMADWFYSASWHLTVRQIRM